MGNFTLTVLAALLSTRSLLGCGHPMNDGDAPAVVTELRIARSELARHHETCMGLAQLSGVPPELARHEQQMGGIMDRMDSRMGGMASHCSGSELGRMRDGMGTMEFEMQAHRSRLVGAATLDEARAECTAHSALMNETLDGMQHSLDDMGCMMGR